MIQASPGWDERRVAQLVVALARDTLSKAVKWKRQGTSARTQTEHGVFEISESDDSFAFTYEDLDGELVVYMDGNDSTAMYQGYLMGLHRRAMKQRMPGRPRCQYLEVIAPSGVETSA